MNDRVKEVFGEAFELSPGDRRRFLDECCGDDDALRRDVERLLLALDAAGDFISHPIELTAAAIAGPDAADDGLEPGQRIGNHQLVDRLGSGGFGTVWRAKQLAPIERVVALKVVRIGCDDAMANAALAVELRALARMQHPGIAKVFDAGTTDDGRPWLAMELVEGAPITAWCEHAGADLRTRLALFRKVCEAVQHAHEKGIVHRDLKPANVLVVERDGSAQPVVIDFGVARAFGESEARGLPACGTPEYMSPELLEGGAASVDTRSDVWSLGILLYELTVGRKPFRLDAGGQAALQRRIRSGDAPPATAAAQKRLPREFDWITQMAMAREPAARYATVAALAEDVGRMLARHPVTAGPGGALYRCRRFVQRHALAIAASLAVVLSLGVGALLAVHGWIEAAAAERTERAEKEQAVREAKRAARVLTLLDGIWNGIDSARFGGRDYPVSQLLGDFERALPTSLAEEPQVEGHLHCTLAQLYRYVGELTAAESQATTAERLAVACDDLDAQAGALVLRSRVRLDTGDVGHALDDARRAQRLSPLRVDAPERFASALEAEALALARQNEIDAALQAAERALTLRETVGEALGIARCHMLLSNLNGQVGRIVLAMHHVQAAIERFHGLGLDHPDAIVARQHLGLLQQRAGDLDAAEASMREVLARRRRVFGEQHAEFALAESDLAWLLHDRQQNKEARDLLEHALPLLRDRLGERHPLVTEAMQRLGVVLATSGDRAAGTQLLTAAVTRFRQLPGHGVDGLIAAMGNLAQVQWLDGEHAAAVTAQEAALALAAEKLPDDHFLRSTGATNLAYMLAEGGEVDRAVKLLQGAMQVSQRAGRAREFELQRAQLAALLRKAGRAGEADQLFDKGR